jgi:Short-chain alcohol dehydrogenase of unknown specificity
MAAYNSSKFAVRGFTETLRMELRSTGVRVTVVCPGITKTRLVAHSPVIDEAQREAMQRQFDSTWGRPPEAVAGAILNAVRRDRPVPWSGLTPPPSTPSCGCYRAPTAASWPDPSTCSLSGRWARPADTREAFDEHDMSLVLEICDWIHVLDFGKPLMAGTAEDVRASEVVRDAYLGKALV